MNRRTQMVENAVEEAKVIHLAFESLASVKQSATLGIDCDTDTDSTSSTSSELNDMDVDGGYNTLTQPNIFSREKILSVLRVGNWNWFELVALAEESGVCASSLEAEYDNMLPQLSEHEHSLLHQSHAALLEMERRDGASKEREVEAFNGNIVSELDSDNPDEYAASNARVLLKKKIAAIHRKNRRDRAKMIAQKRFLQRKKSRRVTGILGSFPDIGKLLNSMCKRGLLVQMRGGGPEC